MYQINIYNNQEAIPLKINTRRLKRILRCILRQEQPVCLSRTQHTTSATADPPFVAGLCAGCGTGRQPGGVFNFILVDNNEIRRVNRKYLGRNRITDVIAFPLSDRKGMPTDDIRGEVVVSVEEAFRQSRKRNISLNKEIALYCIHGLLHLIGYDDMTKSKRLKMELKQSDYLFCL